MLNWRKLSLFIALFSLVNLTIGLAQNKKTAKTPVKKTAQPTIPPFNKNLAKDPPMGWNSWDCLGWTANENHVYAVAEYMEKHLKSLGYEYVILDQCWYADSASSSFEAFVHDEISPKPQYNYDTYGRLLPDTLKFPSAKGGKGFKPLADYLHAKGLKFGLHLVRGIPWVAAEKNLPILGSNARAASIAQPTKGCDWYDGFYGVDMTKPGSQAYYNSVFKLFAEWGVDYIKADDVVNEAEFLAMSRAARASGRDIVLSVVPANIPWETLKANAHVSRTGYDYWDVWQMLKQAFGDANRHTKYRGDGFWPDLDMLPVGKIGIGVSYKGPHPRISNFTKDELYTLLSLWYISKNALMIGGYLPETDPVTYELLTNPEAVEVNKKAVNSRQILLRNAKVAWAADIQGSQDKYIALFNMWETFKPVEIKVDFATLGLDKNATYKVRDLWARKDLGEFTGSFAAAIITHGAGLYRVSKL
jgi:alpha-galactosidase